MNLNTNETIPLNWYKPGNYNQWLEAKAARLEQEAKPLTKYLQPSFQSHLNPKSNLITSTQGKQKAAREKALAKVIKIINSVHCWAKSINKFKIWTLNPKQKVL